MDTAADIVTQLAARQHEEEWFEFKTNWCEPRILGEYVSALSNAAALTGCDEGYLIWGVEDGSHDIVGTTFDRHINVKGEPLEHYIARQLTPSIAFKFEEATVGDKRVVLLRVPAARRFPTAFNGERYLRIGSSKVNLAKHPERKASLFDALTHGLPTMETMEAESQDLSFVQLFAYYAGRGIRLREETFEKNLGLLTPAGRFNLLAQLLSDDSRIPVRVSIFRGSDKASPLISVREFGNTCLLATLDKVLEYGDVINLVQADEKGRVVERQEKPLFDADVYREGVINAFVHNRWVDGNAPMITVYSDRVEILSRGSLAPKQTVEGFFLGESVPVNKRLSDLFLQLHISERSGRGVPKIISAYGRSSYEFRENSISLTIPFEWLGNDSNRKKDGRSRAEASPVGTDTEAAILAELMDNPNLTQPQLSSRLGRSLRTVQRALASLQEEGSIERVGSNKKGYWKVL